MSARQPGRTTLATGCCLSHSTICKPWAVSRGVTYRSAERRRSSQPTNVLRKPSVMLPTPTLAASASKRATNARLKAGSCWRLSATNHCANGRWQRRASQASTRSSKAGNSSAAASSNPASMPNALSRPAPKTPQPKASNSSRPASKACRCNHGPCASRQAWGCASASKGNRAARITLSSPASNAPSTLTSTPSSHHPAGRLNVPATWAPYRPRRLAATSGNSHAANA